jgi:ribonuclease Y
VPSWSWLLIGLAAGLVIGIGIAFVVRQWIASRQVQMASEEAKKLVAEAQEKQKTLLLESKEAAVNMKAEAEASYRETRGELQRLERRLSQKEENLERRDESFQRREQLLSGKEREIEKARNRVEEMRQKQQQQLEQIAGLSSAEAKEILLQKVDTEVRDEASRRVRRHPGDCHPVLFRPGAP